MNYLPYCYVTKESFNLKCEYKLGLDTGDGLLELLEKLGWKRQTPYITHFAFVQSAFVQSRSVLYEVELVSEMIYHATQKLMISASDATCIKQNTHTIF